MLPPSALLTFSTFLKKQYGLQMYLGHVCVCVCVPRAEVRTLLDGRAILDLTLTDTAGAMPPSAAVQRVCEAAGGVQADELDPLMAVAG